jgi:hypothetical protein
MVERNLILFDYAFRWPFSATNSFRGLSMKKRLAAGSGALLAVVILSATASPASAVDWPSGGTFDIPGTMAGGASWQIDEFGIKAGGDTPGAMAHSLYYPLENYAQASYLYCGSSTGDGSDAIVTAEVNGDITIDCPSVADTFVSGLSGTLHIRLYAEAETGYMARVWGELTNTTVSTITIGSDDPLGVYYYYNYDAWDDGDPWMTNAGGGNYGRDGAVWGVGGDIDSNEIATSAAWGDLSQFCRFDKGNNKMFYPAEANVIAAGETVNLISFINMVFPATSDSAGTTAAFETALAHAQTEFAAGLTGRMTDGLPADLVAIGWEKDGACAVPQPEAIAAKLASTGADSASSFGLGAGALALALIGLGFMFAIRPRTRA